MLDPERAEAGIKDYGVRISRLSILRSSLLRWAGAIRLRRARAASAVGLHRARERGAVSSRQLEKRGEGGAWK
ncbi:MAG: hypothetical protein KKE57_04485 [Proteobacteria bacterium]|nr:hypothetical protein [Pseudomonadota bacterium]